MYTLGLFFACYSYEDFCLFFFSPPLDTCAVLRVSFACVIYPRVQRSRTCITWNGSLEIQSFLS